MRENCSDVDCLIAGRINSRESSTLTFATVSASSSLVVLVLALQSNLEASYPWLEPVGIIFSLLGFAYREATIWSIDRTEYEMLKAGKLKRLLEEEETRGMRYASYLRRSLVRFFLLLPFASWLALSWNFGANYLCLGLLMTVIGLVSLIPSVIEPKSKQPINRDARKESAGDG